MLSWVCRLGWETQETSGLAASLAARASVFAQWRSARSGSVSRPCRSIHELKGAAQAPASRRPSTRMRSAKAMFRKGEAGPKASAKTRPW